MITLPRKQLAELAGSSRKSRVIAWLDSKRIPYLIGLDGWPRVSAAVVGARLGESTPSRPEPSLHLT